MRKVLKHAGMRSPAWAGVVVLLFFALFCSRVFAQEGETVPAGIPPRLKFNNAALDIVLDEYSEKTGRTLLRAPGLPKVSITLRSQSKLTDEEYLQAIETVLGMYGVALLKVGDNFLKVVPIAKARQEPMQIREDMEEAPLKEAGELVSQMIPLKHVEIAEATKAITPLKHAYGQIHAFERIGSILVTDTASNINRIMQVIKYLDQPLEAREEPHVIQIRYAKAADIKKKLEEIIAEWQKEVKKSTVPRQKEKGAPGVVKRAPPGVIRAPRPKVTKPEIIAEIIEEAERGIIRGKVKMVADDRTNILIIITRPENMKFFEKIVKVLDVETAPDVIVKIIRLEFADADTVASTLNTLIGEKGKAGTAVTPVKGEEAKSAALRKYVEELGKRVEAKEKTKVGELSAANIKILPDKRTNSLLIMASKSDLMTLDEIINRMDMMLSQVLIEAVLIQVELSDQVTSGMHWVQRALIAYKEKSDGSRGAIGSGAGAVGAGGSALDASSLTSLGSWATGSGLTAYFTHFGLSLDVIVNMFKTDSRTRILSSPVIVTTDNTEAKLTSSHQKYFLKGSTVDQWGNVRPETEIKDIGLELTVTPHITERRNVMMEIFQKASDEGAAQEIADLGKFPTTTTREFKASIAVQDRETIVLGGLVRRSKAKTRTGVPLLSAIPLLGKLFRSDSDTHERAEVVVFVTPYVLDTREDIEAESARRKEALDIKGLWEKGWSDSELADPTEKEPAEQKTRPLKKDASVEHREKQWEKTLKKIDRRIEEDMR